MRGSGKRRARGPILLALICLVPVVARPARAAAWKSLKTGLDYATATQGDARLHAFRVDLKRFKLSPIVQDPPFPVKTAVERAGALLAINANFFDPNKKPLGLVIKDFKVQNPFRSVSWWGVFSVEKNRAAILSASAYQWRPSLETALQSGPRLLSDGKVISGLKELTSEKSVLCIPDPDHVIVSVSEGLVSVASLVQLLKGDLRCQSALNLDGGSSTQLYAKVKGFELDRPAFIAAPVLLGVFE